MEFAPFLTDLSSLRAETEKLGQAREDDEADGGDGDYEPRPRIAKRTRSEPGACQLDDTLRQSVRPDQDEPMPVLLGMVTGSKKGMDRGTVEECDLTQFQQDRVDICPFEMRQAVQQERSRGQIELTYDGYVRDPMRTSTSTEHCC